MKRLFALPGLIILVLLNGCLGSRIELPVSANHSETTTFNRLVSAQTENRTALVMGNSAYQSSPLKNPVNDARAIKKALQQSGFKVIYQENGSRTEMFNKIRDFGNELRQRKGVGVVFYAGHGMQVNGENYLIPVNANINAEDEIEIQALPLQSVLNKLNSAGNKLNMVYLDACRDNPFARSFRSSSRGLARVSAPTGTKIYYATKPGEVAHDGKGANGIFTSHLMKALTTPGLNQNEVFQQTATAVMAETKEQQVPWEEGLITGTFYFTDAPIQVAGGTSQIIPPPQPTALTGTLVITSSPNGATIRLDGASVGATPVTLPNLPANKAYQLSAEKSGYKTEEERIFLTASNQPRVVNFALDALNQPPATHPFTIQPTPANAAIQSHRQTSITT
ncbi:PEGA domain-containing protein [Ectothiorhodospiraceae bacterium BW-2]|nr:PEGA domain-containing protein [Ectothiorhodospiraceae bacterium BW-2]